MPMGIDRRGPQAGRHSSSNLEVLEVLTTRAVAATLGGTHLTCGAERHPGQTGRLCRPDAGRGDDRSAARRAGRPLQPTRPRRRRYPRTPRGRVALTTPAPTTDLDALPAFPGRERRTDA